MMKNKQKILAMLMACFMLLTNLIPSINIYAIDEMEKANNKLSVTMTDIDGKEVWNGVDSSANMEVADVVSKKYFLNITASGTTTSDVNKVVTVSMPNGLRYGKVGDNINSQITEIATPNSAVGDYTNVNTGTRQFNVPYNMTGFGIILEIEVDESFVRDEIQDAIKINFSYDENSTIAINESAKLDSMSIKQTVLPSWRLVNKTPIIVSTGQLLSHSSGHPMCFISTKDDSGSFRNVLVNKMEFTVASSVSGVKLSLSNAAAAEWSLQELADGNYTLTYAKPGGNAFQFGGKISLNNVLVFDDTGGVLKPGGKFSLNVKAKMILDDGNTIENTSVNGWNVQVAIDGADVWAGFTSNVTALEDVPNKIPDTAKVITNASSNATDAQKKDITQMIAKAVVGNRGSEDSGEQNIILNLNSTETGVSGFRINGDDFNILKIEYKTVKNSSAWIDSGINNSTVTLKGLGLKNDDYITALKVKVDTIKAGKSPEIIFIGYNLTNSPQDVIHTVEVQDANDSSITTGIGEFKTTLINDHAYANIDLHSSSITKEAGEKVSLSTKVSGSNDRIGEQYVENPVFYIQAGLLDLSGNPILLTNIKMTDGRTKTPIKIATIGEIAKVNEVEVTIVKKNGKTFYRLDTKNIIDGSAALMARYHTNNGFLNDVGPTISWDIDTSITTGSQSVNWKDTIFMEIPDVQSVTTIASKSQVKDPYNLSTGGTVVSLADFDAETYAIKARKEVLINTFSKHENSIDYSEYTNGNYINIGYGSSFDIKVDIINNSGQTVNNIEAYIPIPKLGENWGNLMGNGTDKGADGKSDTFDFDVKLTGPVDTKSTQFSVLYGKNITPSDNSSKLQSESSSYSDGKMFNSEDWKQVNCVKIVANNLLYNGSGTTAEELLEKNSYHFILSGSVDAKVAEDGLIDVWRPYYYQDTLDNGSGVQQWGNGTYIGIETAMGELKGKVWLDENKDAILDATESNLTDKSGWKINVYRHGDVTHTLVQSMDTDTNGEYHFRDLKIASGMYDIEVINKIGTAICMFTKVGKLGTSQNVFVGDATTAHASASVTGISAYDVKNQSLSDTRGTYNIGVIIPKEKTKITFKSSDSTNAVGTEGTTEGTIEGGASKEYEAFAYETLNLPTVLSKDGFKFQHWSETENGKPVTLSNTFGYENQEYWAVYNPIQYLVKFDGNGSSGTSMNEQTFAYNTAQKLSKNTYIKNGYKFIGWNTQKDGLGVSYNDQQSVSNLTVNDKETITLYAQWEENHYSVVYDKNADTAIGSMASQEFIYEETKELTSNTFTRVGYTFAGWGVKSDGKVEYVDKESVKNLTPTNNGIVTLFAIWNANENINYRIEHYKQNEDGTWNETASEVQTMIGKTDTKVEATPNHYEGYGFDINQAGTVTSGYINGDGSLVLKLYYKVVYSATFDSDGGDYTPEEQLVMRGERVNIPNNPIKSGYQFKGWYCVDTDGSKNEWNFDSLVYDNVKLIAEWTVESNEGPNNSQNPSNPGIIDTSDTTNITLITIAGLLSIVMIIICSKKSKKE